MPGWKALEAKWRRIDAIEAAIETSIGHHLCREHQITLEVALAIAGPGTAAADVATLLEMKTRMPHDPFEGLA